MDSRHASHSTVEDNQEPLETQTTEPSNAHAEERDGKQSPFEREGRSRPWWLIILAIALLVGGGTFAWQWLQSRGNDAAGGSAAQSQPRGVPVQLSSVEPSSIKETSEFVGTLDAKQSVAIRSERSGRLTQLYVTDGDVVEQGQTIARLDSRAVEADLREAEASLSQFEARLAELRAGTRQERIGQAKARLEQAKYRLRNAQSGATPEEIAQAEARVESAQAEVVLTEQRVERYRQLEREGAVSQDTLDEFIEENRTAKANLREAERRLAELQKNQSSNVDELAAEVEELRQELRELENGARPEDIAAAEADVRSAAARVQAREVELQDTRVVAPFSGTIGDIPVKLGDYLNVGDVVTTITQNQFMELEMAIPLEQGDLLERGLPVEISTDRGEFLTQGEISFISPQVSDDSQTILTKATFNNRSGKLRDSQFVRAEVVWQTKEDAIAIPTNAIIFQGTKRFVFVVKPESEPLSVKKQEIKLGIEYGDRSEVLEGLEAGDRIVVSGTQKLADGAPITPMSQIQKQK